MQQSFYRKAIIAAVIFYLVFFTNLKDSIFEVNQDAIKKVNESPKSSESNPLQSNPSEPNQREPVSNKEQDLEPWALAIRGKKVFSQNDEDGAIEEVFKRIGLTDRWRKEGLDMKHWVTCWIKHWHYMDSCLQGS